MATSMTRQGRLPRARGPRPPDWLGRAILYVGLAAVLLYAAILLAPVWILLFASILLAVLLDGAARLLRQRVFRGRLGDNQIAWVLIVVLLAAGVLVALCFLLGPHVTTQFQLLVERLPKAIDRLREDLSQTIPMTHELLDGEELQRLLTPSSAVGRRIVQVFGSVLGALGSVAAVAVIGVYFAAQPRAYLRGCVQLVPRHRVDQAWELLRLTGRALRRWLVGRLSSMAVVFVLTTGALWILGSPLALSLGLLAGLLSFIPFIGPLLSAVPAILLGFLESQLQALWIALAYIAVQVIEGNLLTPLIQSYAVALRPAVLLGAQLIAGSLFGLPGVLFATPLAVVFTVFVQFLYVRCHLGKDVRILGESASQ